MVLEKVWVFLQIDALQGEFAKTLAPIGIAGAVRGDAASAEFGTGAVLCVERERERVVSWMMVFFLGKGGKRDLLGSP